MSSPRFLADEDLRSGILRVFRRLAPHVEVTTVVEEGLKSKDDDEVLEFAWRGRWLLVSHDVNTMKALAERRIATGAGIHGLFLAAQQKPTFRIAESMALVSEASHFEEWRDRIVYLPL